jgi:hypothetical protein
MAQAAITFARARCFSDEPRNLHGDDRDAFG